jgi:hypothetical protein
MTGKFSPPAGTFPIGSVHFSCRDGGELPVLWMC